MCCYYPHFKNENIEAERGKGLSRITRLRSSTTPAGANVPGQRESVSSLRSGQPALLWAD